MPLRLQKILLVLWFQEEGQQQAELNQSVAMGTWRRRVLRLEGAGGMIRKGLPGEVALNWEPGRGTPLERMVNAKAIFDS